MRLFLKPLTIIDNFNYPTCQYEKDKECSEEIEIKDSYLKWEFSLIFYRRLIINNRKIYDAWKYVFIAAHVTQVIIDAET